MDKDIALPVLSPILARKKALAEEIAGLDIAAMTCPVLPLKEDDTTAQTFKYEGYDIITLKKIIERDYAIPEAQTSQEVIFLLCQAYRSRGKITLSVCGVSP